MKYKILSIFVLFLAFFVGVPVASAHFYHYPTHPTFYYHSHYTPQSFGVNSGVIYEPYENPVEPFQNYYTPQSFNVDSGTDYEPHTNPVEPFQTYYTPQSFTVNSGAVKH
jgi:hypothetical protein